MRRDLVLAVVTDALEPFHTGGKEARYASVLPRLAPHGIRVDVHTMRWWGRHCRPPQLPGVHLHALSPYWPLYAGERRSIVQAVGFAVSSLRMLTRRFDVLEADAIPFLQLFPLRLVATLRRKRFVVTWHEVWGRDYWVAYLGRFGRLAAALERWAASLPDHIVAASEGTASRLIALGVPRDRVTVVPNGVDRTEIDAAHAVDVVGDVLCVGRLLAHKNVDLVIAAVAELRARGRDIRLTVIGTGPELVNLTALADRLDIDEYVDILPPLPRRCEVLGAMKGAKVLAFPSVREGFGLVAVEALACGTPVVTSDHPDNEARHLVSPGVNGQVCAPTVTDLADALSVTLDNHNELGRAATETGDEYSWDTLAATVAKVVHA